MRSLDDGELVGFKVVAILAPLFLIEFFDRTLIAAVLPGIAKDFPLSDGALGALGGTSFAIGLSAALMPAGYLADRFDRRWVVAGGVLFWCAMTVASGLSRSYAELFVSRIGLGVGEAALGPAAYAMVSDCLDPARRPLAMGWLNVAANVGAALALALGGLFVTDALLPAAMTGWRAGFVVTGCAGMAAAFLPLLLPKAAARPRPPALGAPAGRTLGAFLREGAPFLTVFSLGIIVASLFSNGAGFWQPTFYMRTFGLDAAFVGAMLGAIGLATGAAGALGAGLLAMRVTRARRRESSLDLLFWCLLLMPPLTAMAFTPLPLWLNAGANTLDTMIAAMLNPLALVCLMSVIPPHLRGRVLAAVSFSVQLAGYTLGPYAYGFAADALGYGDAGFWIAAAALSVLLTTASTVLVGVSRPLFRRMAGEDAAPGGSGPARAAGRDGARPDAPESA